MAGFPIPLLKAHPARLTYHRSDGMQGTAAAQPGLTNEVSLYQSPMSHHSVCSFGGGSPSPQPAARGTPKQATPATPQPIQAAAGGAPDLLQSIRNGQYHLRKMSFSYQPKGELPACSPSYIRK